MTDDVAALRARVAELEQERESRRRVGRPPRRATSADGRLVARARALLAVSNTQLAARIGYHPSVLSHDTLSAAVRAAVIAAIDTASQKHS
jgi:ribosome-binding protein aMBF1 (putative translation factor)